MKKGRGKMLFLVIVLVLVLAGIGYWAATSGAPSSQKKAAPADDLGVIQQAGAAAQGVADQAYSLWEQAKDQVADWTIDLSGATATQEPS